MKINYLGQFRANIVLDGDLTYHGMNDDYRPLQDYIDKATYLMGEYGFQNAQIVDDDDGNIILEMESDCNDCYPDDGPAYYDDGDTCGYE